MVNGNLVAPYEGAAIEAANIPRPLRKAKEWAASVEVAHNSWLQILLMASVRSHTMATWDATDVPTFKLVHRPEDA
jgi:hypothetical protein